MKKIIIVLLLPLVLLYQNFTPLVNNSSGKQAFAMISGYKMEKPYEGVQRETINKALSDLTRVKAAGIVYSNLGLLEDEYRISNGASGIKSELQYNNDLFADAQAIGADVWLQVRVFENRIWLSKQNYVNVFADQIINDPEVQRQFLRRFRNELDIYNTYFSEKCTVILFEEETIYHQKNSGGEFWAGANWPISQVSGALNVDKKWDTLFAYRLTAIYELMRREIERLNPHCKVGVHIGHAPVYLTLDGTTVYGKFFQTVKDHLKPDFTLYDLYQKTSKTAADFHTKLKARVEDIRKVTLNRPVYYLSQLHVVNNFQHGMGRGPSQKDIEDTLALAKTLNLDGFGYYTKNALPNFAYDDAIQACFYRGAKNVYTNYSCSRAEDTSPFDPNYKLGQKMVYDINELRWKIGLSALKNWRIN